jgi:DNA polymerase-1
LKYAKLEKLYSSFMIGLLREVYLDGKVHPSFNICGTDSWRLSCDHPNLQQLPRPLEKPKKPTQDYYIDEQGRPDEVAFLKAMQKYEREKEEYDFWIQFEIRSLMIPDDDDSVILSSDFSNLEKRVSAHMSEDVNLIKLITEGYDGHGFIATLIFDECKDMNPNDVKKKKPALRQIAKTVGFAIDYGGSEYTVAKNLDIPKEVARKYIDKYFEGFYGLAEWGINQKRFARRYGYTLTILGHKRHLSGINSENMKIRGYNERVSLNAPIQGSAADICSRAQIIIENDPILSALGCRAIIQVHDEIVFTCPKKFKYVAMERIKYFMEHSLPKPMIIPLIAEIDFGSTYAEAK